MWWLLLFPSCSRKVGLFLCCTKSSATERGFKFSIYNWCCSFLSFSNKEQESIINISSANEYRGDVEFLYSLNSVEHLLSHMKAHLLGRAEATVLKVLRGNVCGFYQFLKPLHTCRPYKNVGKYCLRIPFNAVPLYFYNLS